MDRRLSRALPLILLLLLQPVVPQAVGHSGHDHDSGPERSTYANEQGVIIGPQAQRLTDDRYVEQRNPHAHGDLIVWQHRELGRDWDIFAFNLSHGGPAFPVTVSAEDQTEPFVRGSWVAWVEVRPASERVEVVNLQSGEQFLTPPGDGGDQSGPVLTHDAVYWKEQTSGELGYLRGMDLRTGELLAPIGNKKIVSTPAAHGPYLGWAEGTGAKAKLKVMDTSTGETLEVPDVWNIVDGPTLSQWGITWISQNSGTQGGTYTSLYNWTEQRHVRMSNGLYPHANVGSCETGVIWDQTSPEARVDEVVIWDGYTEKTAAFGAWNYRGTCTNDWLIYEKEVLYDDPDLDRTFLLYILDLRSARPPTKADVRLDEDQENRIVRERTRFTGVVEMRDPREELRSLWVGVDGSNLELVPTERTGLGTYRFEYVVDPNDYFNGEHTLTVISVDGRGTQTERHFAFFTHGLYEASSALYEQDLRIPRTEAQPFPFNVLQHYKDFAPFYNTVILVLVLVAVGIYFLTRYLQREAIGTPQLVRHDRSDEPSPGGGGDDRSQPRTFRRV